MNIPQNLINTLESELSRLQYLTKDLLDSVKNKLINIKGFQKEQEYEAILEERKQKPQATAEKTSVEKEESSLLSKLLLGGGLAAAGIGGSLFSGNTEASTNPYAPSENEFTPNTTKGVGETGSSTEAIAFFESKGWTKEQAIGIVANLQAESGANLRTDALGDGRKAYGIAQWHPPRQQTFERIYGKPIREAGFKEQLEFVNWELNNSHKSAGKALRQTTTIEESTSVVDAKYEISALGQKGIHTKRIANARELQKTPNKSNEDKNIANAEKVKEERSTPNNPQASIEPVREAPQNNKKAVQLAESKPRLKEKIIMNNIMSKTIVTQIAQQTVSNSDTTVSDSLPSSEELKAQYRSLA
jgi:hypothetical protein